MDGYVQLAHVQKNSGHTAAAISSFARALEIDQHCPDALRELISLGKGAIAGTKTNVGFELLAEVRSTLTHLKKATKEIERMLPDIQSLCSVPATNFTLFRERFQLLRPPERPQPITWSAVIIDDGVSDVLATLRTVAQQRIWQSVQIYRARPGAGSRAGADIKRRSLLCPVRFLESGRRGADAEADWLLLIKAGTETGAAGVAVAGLGCLAESTRLPSMLTRSLLTAILTAASYRAAATLRPPMMRKRGRAATGTRYSPFAPDQRSKAGIRALKARRSLTISNARRAQPAALPICLGCLVAGQCREFLECRLRRWSRAARVEGLRLSCRRVMAARI